MSDFRTQCRDFRRIESALAFLDTHRRQQPSLDEVARHIGLSPFHFQRLFTTWAGVTPKRFLQFLTREHAKAVLDGNAKVLEAAYEAGLSGPGRLHDLFVETTAVTPGEYKSGGQGLNVCYGVHQTPFGYCAIALTPRGVCSLAFLEDRDPAQFAAVLHADWPQAHVCEDQARTAPWVQRIFSPATHRAPIPAVLHGTNFQIQVWEALLCIPTGTVTSYESLAQAIGKPEATRAVASAVAHNRIAFVIPCHRVIRKIGEAGEYRWGRARKRALLGWEASQRTGESS